MIPSPERIVEGVAFLARRYGVLTRASRSLVQAAVEEATRLASQEADEPAALFYALARRQRAFPGVYSRTTAVLVLNQALRLHLMPRFTPDDLLPLYRPVASGEIAFSQVRAWFAARYASE